MVEYVIEKDGLLTSMRIKIHLSDEIEPERRGRLQALAGAFF